MKKYKFLKLLKWMTPLERAGKTDEKMLWFDMIRLKVLEIFNVETTFTS